MKRFAFRAYIVSAVALVSLIGLVGLVWATSLAEEGTPPEDTVPTETTEPDSEVEPEPDPGDPGTGDLEEAFARIEDLEATVADLEAALADALVTIDAAVARADAASASAQNVLGRTARLTADGTYTGTVSPRQISPRLGVSDVNGEWPLRRTSGELGSDRLDISAPGCSSDSNNYAVLSLGSFRGFTCVRIPKNP